MNKIALRKKPDPIDFIIQYEEGTLDERNTLILFAALITSGLAWRLQGHYGRTAQDLLDNGLIIQEPGGRYVPDLARVDHLLEE